MNYIYEAKPLQVGDSILSVSYEDFTADAEIIVLPKQLQSIEIIKAPLTTEYYIGQYFDATGMIVVAHYEYLEEEILPSIDLRPLTIEDGEVLLSYTYDYVTKTVNQPIVVLPKQAITVENVEILIDDIAAQATTSGESHAYEYAVTLNVPQGGGTYTFRIEPIELNGGNVGLAAIAVMAGAPAVTATVESATAKQLNDGDTVNLTEKGTTDWYVPNGEKRKENGTAISTEITYQNENGNINTNPGGSNDYKAQIVLNGSETTTDFCFTDSSIKIEMTLTKGTHTVYVYATAWQASYLFRTVDMNGEELSNVVARDMAGNGSEAYEYAVTLNVETAGTYTFEIVAIDRNGGNVGLAAVAVA